ncbi:MAG: hypothetical protein RR314_04680 [Oscillospiraceae bacterium]
MKIQKSGRTDGVEITEAELAEINAFAKTKLAPEEVYAFSVLLCDNEVDRDFERFTEKTLGELRELFVGRTGITDHDWASERQKARIYRCELVTDAARKNSQGAPYMYLRGCAYMLRTEGNAELIAEIEGGIKRETSVGCSVAKTLCSVCGAELGSGACAHVKGESYGGKLCYGELSGAVDAYEWSFVAVPAQREAGVLKKARGKTGPSEGELRELEKRAVLGDKYLRELRGEVLRLGLLCDRGLGDALTKSAERMESDELEGFKKAFEARLAERFPPLTQLPGRNETVKLVGNEYKI